ncbi:MAG TPA: hypothetical protein ENK98_04435, partial [Epsilonproteobacteria bacterium]|nr:hypothetical protein [Campylobacterota bacterium]
MRKKYEKKILLLSLCASTSLFAQNELEEPKALLAQQIKTTQALQKRVVQLEKKQAKQAKVTKKQAKEVQQAKQQIEVVQNTQQQTPTTQTTGTFSQKSFLPDISLILDTSYVSRNKKDEALNHLEIPGIAHGIMGEHSHGDGHSHAPLNAHDGFNLNYVEVAMQSNIDPYLSLTGIFHLSENNFEVEEAYAESTGLGYGLKAKIGKFRSNFGRINVQHSHVQDFSDMPLVYTAFLGGHGIDDIGAQLQWTLPTDTYFMAGFEALQGKNPSMYGVDAIAPEGDEENIVVDSPNQPNLLIGYLKSSFDIDNTSVLYGASIAYGDSRVNHLSDEEPHAFVAKSYLYGADLTVKHYFDSYSYLSFQGEYLYRDMDGDFYTYSDDEQTAFNITPTVKEQGGYYAQLVYAYNRNYRFGIRYDNINKNDIMKNNLSLNTENNFDRYTAMIDYSPSEFTRFRLQYNQNNAMFNEEGERQNINSLIL